MGTGGLLSVHFTSVVSVSSFCPGPFNSPRIDTCIYVEKFSYLTSNSHASQHLTSNSQAFRNIILRTRILLIFGILEVFCLLVIPEVSLLFRTSEKTTLPLLLIHLSSHSFMVSPPLPRSHFGQGQDGKYIRRRVHI
jgi:hypothetical protein